MMEWSLPTRWRWRFVAALLCFVGVIISRHEDPTVLSPSVSSLAEETRSSAGCEACRSSALTKLGFTSKEGWRWPSEKEAAAGEFAKDLMRRLLEIHRAGLPGSVLEFERREDIGSEVWAALDLSEGTAYAPRAVCQRVAACSDPNDRDDGSWSSVRVSHAHASRGYPYVRVSRVYQGPALAGYEYNALFKYRWQEFQLASQVYEVVPGRATRVAGVDVWLPSMGEGSVGVWIADPCVSSEFVLCALGALFRTYERTPALLNAMASRVDYWAIWGDNLYDLTGELSREFFDRLSDETLSRILMTTAGNHDYFVDGSPKVATINDQYGNGFMQFYAQDAVAALRGDVFNFSVDPDRTFATHDNATLAVKAAKADISNFVWWHLMGNVAYVGFSSAYDFATTRPYMRDACAWARDTYDAGLAQLVVLAAHWSANDDGAQYGMSAPSMYDRAAAGELGADCERLAAIDRLKFVEGHTHCNEVVVERTGFVVAGQGMSDCGQYAIAVLDTRNATAKLVNFPLADTRGFDQYDIVFDCFLKATNLVADCGYLGEIWLDQSLDR
ncbi:hypothetical protein CTAYLR_008550 [Chrysophaeum taylorii]|uniref:Calcineurin-like phosphoesterase domain-containing protein n=1 Tax=Chrysophaeum taylorii TaxID=2483200 RepID=A0AAD7XHR1_9STRA|nr:hypothetical protein CTAYLR_008550 [Chrysophaeum taylorii]